MSCEKNMFNLTKGTHLLNSTNFFFIFLSLKPENVLIDKDGFIRVTDFGLSKKNIKNSKDAHSVCGTPEYLAPEVIMKKGHGKPVDWWTLGKYEWKCSMYKLNNLYILEEYI